MSFLLFSSRIKQIWVQVFEISRPKSSAITTPSSEKMRLINPAHKDVDLGMERSLSYPTEPITLDPEIAVSRLSMQWVPLFTDKLWNCGTKALKNLSGSISVS